MLSALLMLALVATECATDADCQDAGVCVDGTCALSSPPPPAAPNPDDYPEVVRKPGMTCVRTLGDDGVVREDCRRERTGYSGQARVAGEAPSRPPPPPRASTERERSTVLADFALLGSAGFAISGTTAAMGGVGLHASVQGLVTESVALGGLADAQLWFPGGGVVMLATLAPALRLGGVGHATLGLGPSVVYRATPIGSQAGFVATLMVHAALPFADALGLHARFSVSIAAGGAFLCLAVGLGGSVY